MFIMGKEVDGNNAKLKQRKAGVSWKEGVVGGGNGDGAKFDVH